jgi:Prokaryotic N-terminal methylation motif
MHRRSTQLRADRPGRPAPRPSHRAGKTLLELLIVVSIIAVVMATGMRLMHVLFRAERTGTRKAAETVTLAQLGREFRRDVRMAASADLVPSRPGGGATLQLRLPGDLQIIYAPEAGRVVRRVIRARKPESQQIFRLPGRSILFELALDQADTDQAAVTLVCQTGPAVSEASTPGRLPVRIVAVVSRDHRLARLEP